MLQVGWISRESQAVFGELLLEDARKALERGEPITALGLTEGARACGAAAAWLGQGDTLEIQSLYVAPGYRRQGGGRLLVDTLCGLAQGRCQRVSICYTCTRPDHETLPPFLTALGFAPEPEGEGLYQITLEELACTPFFSHTPPDAGGLPFDQVPRHSLAEAYQRAAGKGENYLPVPLTHPSVDGQTSTAILEGDVVRSFAVITFGAPGRVRLAWVQSGVPQDIPALLRGAFHRLRAKYPPKTALTIHPVAPAAGDLVARLIPVARPISHAYTRSLAR